MSWTNASDLRTQVMRLWERGLLLRAVAGQGDPFPWRLQFRCPSSGEMAGRFEEVRQWAAALRELAHVRIEARSFNHRILGLNTLPCEAWLDSLDDALALIGKREAATRFRHMLELTACRVANLQPWLLRKPLRSLDVESVWPQLLDIVEWRLLHPQPAIYLRQVEVPGVHTKFIESHRSVLAELLDQALPPESVDQNFVGLAGFARRYGFRDKSPRVRFRTLDPDITVIAGHSKADISVDAATFARLSISVRRVFVTENEINYLSFPDTPGGMVIFGAGYGWEMLAEAKWLHNQELWYWGDIDTHGFAILHQLRKRLPHVQSFLMDRETLMAHSHAWSTESSPTSHALPMLTTNEREVYGLLRDDELRKRLRLEQEFIGYAWISAAINRLTEPSGIR
jgi:hypothetical protein